MWVQEGSHTTLEPSRTSERERSLAEKDKGGKPKPLQKRGPHLEWDRGKKKTWIGAGWNFSDLRVQCHWRMVWKQVVLLPVPGDRTVAVASTHFSWFMDS